MGNTSKLPLYMDKKKSQLPLQVVHVDKLATAINRAHILLHSLLVSAFLYHRLSLLLPQNDVVSPPLFPNLVLFLAEILLSLLWLSQQALRWRVVERSVFIDRLPEDESHLPAIDVFICTADPDKEPTVEVMNTVVSAMALDYPIDKLHVYLSDDGGAEATRRAMEEAWGFATWWVPFCRRYKVECRCPMAYFGDHTAQQQESSGVATSDDFIRDRTILKEKYEAFKWRVEMNLLQLKTGSTDSQHRNNHPPIIQVINEKCIDASLFNPDNSEIPLLVYISREKRPSHPHNFKAGALNVLLRVSSLLSNSPVLLLLDCDMYCNNPTSAKQAMCFYLDKHISPSLGFVQFPQRFHNLSKHEIYEMDFRWVFKGLLRGMDGVGTGPIMCGSGAYMNRKALLYSDCAKGLDSTELRKTFGPSNDFIKTLCEDIITPKATKILREAEFVASCSYEEETKWGDGAGFYYYSVTEDYFTGYNLHIRGWKSVYLNPQRASFLGTSTTNLNDLLIQNTRWTAGLSEIGLSKFCPLFHGPSRRHLSLLHRSCTAWFGIYVIDSLSYWCLAVIPQLCLFYGIPIYSKVSSSLFPMLASLVFVSSLLRNLLEALTTGGTISSWWNEQSIWTLKMLTSHTYGGIDAIMKILGLKKTSFIPTNKVVDEDQAKMYQQGLYDFQTSHMFLVPLGSAVILNLVCFVVGAMRMVVVGDWDEMAVQVALSAFFLVMSKPVVEGMVVRRDKGRFPGLATFKCVGVCLVLLVLAPLIISR